MKENEEDNQSIIQKLYSKWGAEDIKSMIKSLPAIIPYLGPAYASASTDIAIRNLNTNLENLIKELIAISRTEYGDAIEKIQKIIDSNVKNQKIPEFITNCSLSPIRKDLEYCLDFTLSNTGGSIIHVRKIWIEVSNKRCEEVHIHTSEIVAGIINEYNYTIKLQLDPNLKVYTIEEKAFSYKNGDIDRFKVSLRAKGHRIYYIQLFIEFVDVRTNIPQIKKSKIYEAHFETFESFEEMISENILAIVINHPEILKAHSKIFEEKPGLVSFFVENSDIFKENLDLFLIFYNEPEHFLEFLDKTGEFRNKFIRKKKQFQAY
jgi:hypothetical protein